MIPSYSCSLFASPPIGTCNRSIALAIRAPRANAHLMAYLFCICLDSLSVQQEPLSERGEEATEEAPCSQCIICEENAANVRFEPCKHQICCDGCCAKMKKCIACQQAIQEKVDVATERIVQRIDYCVVSNQTRAKKKSTPDTSFETIVQKTDMIKKIMTGCESQSDDPNTMALEGDRLRYLESKIAEIEEANCCGICMEVWLS